MEAASAKDLKVRERLRRTIDAIRGRRPLLPSPFALLKQIGHAYLSGSDKITLGRTNVDDLLSHGTSEPDRERVSAFLMEIEERHSKTHRAARHTIQQYLKDNSLRGSWESLGYFLDSLWSAEDNLSHFAERVWGALRLPGAAPTDKLIKDETWKLFLEAEGISVYQRGVMFEQPKQVHRVDLLQLPYLSLGRRRILVTADRPFLLAAQQLLGSRYQLSRVSHIQDFLE